MQEHLGRGSYLIGLSGLPKGTIAIGKQMDYVEGMGISIEMWIEGGMLTNGG